MFNDEFHKNVIEKNLDTKEFTINKKVYLIIINNDSSSSLIKINICIIEYLG